MTMTAKNCHVIIRSANIYHTLVVCYHANCSISYLASAYVWIVDSEVIKCETGHRRGWDMGGKDKWKMGERE